MSPYPVSHEVAVLPRVFPADRGASSPCKFPGNMRIGMAAAEGACGPLCGC